MKVNNTQIILEEGEYLISAGAEEAMEYEVYHKGKKLKAVQGIIICPYVEGIMREGEK